MEIAAHICCGPCAVVFAGGLAAQNPEYKLRLLWHNPNIHPFTEYRARQQAAAAYAAAAGLAIIGADGGGYGLRPFLRAVHGADNRCEYCYHSRLEFTAKYAAAAGLGGFTTTLLASPYQNFDAICRIGGDLARQYGLVFVAPDFRADYRKGLTEAAEMALYRQKYCGCVFSEEERYS